MEALTNIIIASTQHNKPILTDIYFKKNKIKKPLVIFCHGYKGYKDWGAWNLMVSEFVNSNLAFVKFNFSHNGGTVENPIDFPDLEAFGQNNFVIELDDLEDVINSISLNKDFSEEIDTEHIILIGHSRGGGIVTLKAAENTKVKKVITWSAVSDFGARFPTGDILKYWEKAGISHIENARTKQQMPHYFQFYTNFKENEARLTIKNAVSNLKIPHLIIHGGKDTVVPPAEAENLHTWNPASTLLMLDEMDHPLGCKQPWLAETMPEYLKIAVEKTIEFIG